MNIFKRILIGSIAVMVFNASADDRERGEYMATLLGCHVCHTQGMLTGDNAGPLYAGSTIGITFVDGRNPPVAFPANLTPDLETGIGRWSIEEIAGAIQEGTHLDGDSLSHVMPSVRFADLADDDAQAIAVYLKSLPAFRQKVPDHVPAGSRSAFPYVKIITTTERR